MANKRTQIDRLFRRLRTGKNLTVTEARNRFGVTSVRQRVHDLRNAGFTIYTNTVKVNGRKVTAYRLDRNSL